MSRIERRRVRWFFAGLLLVSAVINLVGAFLVRHESRSALIGSMLPSSVSLGSRTGVVLSSVVLMFLARGVARGKRVAWQLTCIVLLASIGFELVKDLDFEDAALSAWILCGLWWMRHDFTADSDPASLRRGLLILIAGCSLAIVYAVGGALLLGNQLSPGFGVERTLEHLVKSMVTSQSEYTALTGRADWFLGSLPVIAYCIVLIALIELLRPAIAPLAHAGDRENARRILGRYGRNRISHLAIYGAKSFYRGGGDALVAYSLFGRTALVLGDPVCDPPALRELIEDFSTYCDRQDWIPAFYQVDDGDAYRKARMSLVRIGSEALVTSREFSLGGGERHDVRYAVRRCERAGVKLSLLSGPEAWSALEGDLKAVSEEWLGSRGGPELGYSLGTLETLRDPAVTAAVATSRDGRVEAFVSWLPVPLRNGWTLDLMRRRPHATYGVMEALLARSIGEATSRGIEDVSLGLVPIPVGTDDRVMKAVYWSVNRFERGASLYRFKQKFGPRWEDRYLAVPNTLVLPEVLVALARAHLPRWLPAAARLALHGAMHPQMKGRLSPTG